VLAPCSFAVLRVIRQLQGAVDFLIISIIATDFRPVKRKCRISARKLRLGTKNMRIECDFWPCGEEKIR